MTVRNTFHPGGAILVAIEYAEAVSLRAWDEAHGKPPRERLQITLAAVLESLRAMIGTALEKTPPMPEG